jgi:choline dehydrogenase-like flavoprotein
MSPARRRQLASRARARVATGLRAFAPVEQAVLESIASLIVPSDHDTPGVGELGVLGPAVGQTLAARVGASRERQEAYARGLLAFDELAVRRYGSAFAALTAVRQEGLLRDVAALYQRRLEPRSTAGKVQRKLERLLQSLTGTAPAIDLFPVLREDVIEAFYTSEPAWIWLGYDGPPMPRGYANVLEARPPSRHHESASVRDAADSLAARSTSPAIHTAPRGAAVDVVVVGSGAGGAVVAKELGEAGFTVVVLEAGRRFDPFTDYVADRVDFEVFAKDAFRAEDAARDLYTTAPGRPFAYTRVKGVGGSTLKYAGMSPRLHESDFRVRSEDGVAEDWPIAYADLEPYYARVEHELGVSGPSGVDANPFEAPRSGPFPTPPHPFNRAGIAVKRGAEALGLHMVREPLAMPSREWNGRPACIGAGTCHLGCSIWAKSSMDVTYVARAEATGRVEVRSECMASRIVLGRDGRARGVVYFDKEGREQAVNARAVVLAANAVETPRLLLLSACSQFPHGVANSSGLVGKYFMEHLAVFAHGLFPERLDPWRGTPTGGMIQDYYATNRRNDFARGWTILVTANSHWPLAMARRVAGWGAAHKARVQQVFGHSVCLASIGEQLPNVQNQVTLDPTARDALGLPAPHLINEPRENDRAMIRAISASLRAVLEAAGATEIWRTEQTPGASSHYLGTCRMGRDPATSVVDARGRAHDVPNLFVADGSAFVTGGAVNPALTISALATRTAAGIVSSAKAGEL